MSSQQAGGHWVVDWAAALVLGGVTAAFLFPIVTDAWLNDFDTSGMSNAGEALHSVGDVVIVLAFFIFLFWTVFRRSR